MELSSLLNSTFTLLFDFGKWAGGVERRYLQTLPWLRFFSEGEDPRSAIEGEILLLTLYYALVAIPLAHVISSLWDGSPRNWSKTYASSFELALAFFLYMWLLLACVSAFLAGCSKTDLQSSARSFGTPIRHMTAAWATGSSKNQSF